ncbi:hypothetical protein C3747_176g78 [Trypanosoma cruzi]|uniref:Uncharacterized protein n=1 Tax=Trypanosoma cruzi TaxID=5693 RepID=A0A2V2W4P6_TRYCR|nr:hypothetical protein C3747_176g78 [Trypanosoma cruzi]
MSGPNSHVTSWASGRETLIRQSDAENDALVPRLLSNQPDDTVKAMPFVRKSSTSSECMEANQEELVVNLTPTRGWRGGTQSPYVEAPNGPTLRPQIGGDLDRWNDQPKLLSAPSQTQVSSSYSVPMGTSSRRNENFPGRTTAGDTLSSAYTGKQRQKPNMAIEHETHSTSMSHNVQNALLTQERTSRRRIEGDFGTQLHSLYDAMVNEEDILLEDEIREIELQEVREEEEEREKERRVREGLGDNDMNLFPPPDATPPFEEGTEDSDEEEEKGDAVQSPRQHLDPTTSTFFIKEGSPVERQPKLDSIGDEEINPEDDVDVLIEKLQRKYRSFMPHREQEKMLESPISSPLVAVHAGTEDEIPRNPMTPAETDRCDIGNTDRSSQPTWKSGRREHEGPNEALAKLVSPSKHTDDEDDREAEYVGEDFWPWKTGVELHAHDFWRKREKLPSNDEKHRGILDSPMRYRGGRAAFGVPDRESTLGRVSQRHSASSAASSSLTDDPNQLPLPVEIISQNVTRETGFIPTEVFEATESSSNDEEYEEDDMVAPLLANIVYGTSRWGNTLRQKKKESRAVFEERLNSSNDSESAGAFIPSSILRYRKHGVVHTPQRSVAFAEEVRDQRSSSASETDEQLGARFVYSRHRSRGEKRSATAPEKIITADSEDENEDELEPLEERVSMRTSVKRRHVGKSKYHESTLEQSSLDSSSSSSSEEKTLEDSVIPPATHRQSLLSTKYYEAEYEISSRPSSSQSLESPMGAVVMPHHYTYAKENTPEREYWYEEDTNPSVSIYNGEENILETEPYIRTTPIEASIENETLSQPIHYNKTKTYELTQYQTQQRKEQASHHLQEEHKMPLCARNMEQEIRTAQKAIQFKYKPITNNYRCETQKKIRNHEKSLGIRKTIQPQPHETALLEDETPHAIIQRQREHRLGLDHDEAQPLEAALLEDEAPHAVVERQREHRLGLDHDEAQPLEAALLEDEAPHAVVERQREHRLGLDHDEAQPLEAALLEDEAPHAVVERQREHRLGLEHDEAQPLEAALHSEREGEPIVMAEKRYRDLAARDRHGFTAREAALLEDEAPHAVVERQREHRLGLDHDEAQPLEAALLEDEAPHAVVERQREHRLGLEHDEAQPLEAALLEDEAPHAVVERQREHRLGLDHDEAQPLEAALLEDEAPHAVVERQREHRLGLDHDEAQPLEAALHSEREGEPIVMAEKRYRDLAARDRHGFTAREAALLEDEAPHAVVERQREHRLGLDHDEAQPLEAALLEDEAPHAVVERQREHRLGLEHDEAQPLEAALLEDEAPHAVVERQREHRLGLDHDEAQPLEAALLEDEAPHAVVERQREHRLGLEHDEAQPLEAALLEDEAPHAVVERQREHRLGLDHDEAQPLEAALHSEREGEPIVMAEKRYRDLAARDRHGLHST